MFGALPQDQPSEADSYSGEYRQERYYQAESEDFDPRYDQRPAQAQFSGVNTSYDGSEYAGVSRFEDEHSNYKHQVHSTVRSVDPTATVQSERPIYQHGGSRSPSYDGDKLLLDRERPNYKPSALRWPFLSLLLLTLLSFIGLLVYAMYGLPRRQDGLEFLARRSEVGIMGRASSEGVEMISSSPASTETVFTVEVSTADVSTTEALTTDISTAEVSTADISTVDVSTADVSTADVSTTESHSNSNPSITSQTLVNGPSQSNSISYIRATGTNSASIASSRAPDDYGNISGALTSSASIGDGTGGNPMPTPPMSRPEDDFGDISAPITNPPPTTTPAPDDLDEAEPVTTVVTIRPTDDNDEDGDTNSIVDNGDDDDDDDEEANEGNNDATDEGNNNNSNDDDDDDDDGGNEEVVQTIVLRPTLTVETDSAGTPTTTITKYPSFTAVRQTSQTSILTNSEGEATSTIVTKALVIPSTTIIETDSNGTPTATSTGYGAIPTSSPSKATVVTYWSMTWGQYFIGTFLPTILAVVISIPIRILDLNARLLQPWHELTHSSTGVSGRGSLCAETGGWAGMMNTIRWAFGGRVTVAVTGVLVLASSLLVPLSAEAIAFDLQGGDNCTKGSGKGKGCKYVVSVFDSPLEATLALLALMALLVLILLAFLARWRSGVATNPWSIAGLAALSRNGEVKGLFPGLEGDGADVGKTRGDALMAILKDRFFALGYFYNKDGEVEYGVVLREEGGDDTGRSLGKSVRDSNPSQLDQAFRYEGQAPGGAKPKHHQPFFMLGYTGRGILLLVLCGILVLILYYNNTGGETGFEHFMMSESFGVRFLFTGVGFIITLCWSSFFNSKHPLNY